MADQKLGKYEVQDRLGRGGMAEVYRAYHANLDRYVAIKVLHAFLAEDDEFRERFEKEARNIAKLNHAHIVQVYDFDYAPDRDSYYMVMELIDGETLKDRLHDLAARNEKLPLNEALRIIREAASALAYAHSRGMIHRDVKPANLMIDQDNRVVLTDFGIAKMLNSKQLTVSGGMIGTPAYMAPEQGLGEPGDERSDLYSLGVIMYQLLTGDLPYDAETALGIILMHVNDPVPDIRRLNPDIPESIQFIVSRSMAKDPERRYHSADEMIDDIERAERGEKLEMPLAMLEEIELNGADSIAGQASTSAKVTAESKAVANSPQQNASKKRGGISWRIASLVVFVVLLAGGGYFIGANSGLFPAPAIGFFVTETPTETEIPPTATPTLLPPTETATDVPPTEVIAAVIEDSTETPTATAVLTDTQLPTATSTRVPTLTPTVTATLDLAITPSPSPNPSQTAAAIQTATIDACTFDYAIVEQIPPDGVDGGFFPVNQAYTRDITLLNTGTCAWGENTSLTFASGEDFNAGPRIFIRESVDVGEEVTLTFEGTTPLRGNATEPLVGTWQLRTRGQKQIGDPLEIGVMVFDPGTGN